MDANQELRAAVDGLYAAFKPYRLREHIEGCPCCVSDGDNRKLRSVPLAELSSEQLRRYTFKAVTTWGTTHEFRHFLPRIAELMSFDPQWPLELPIVTGKLTYAEWDAWPLTERTAIQRYLEAWWLTALSEFPCPAQWQNINDVLCAIGRAEKSVEPYLAKWLRCSDLSAMRHLADFVIGNYPSLKKSKKLAGAFWDDREQQRQQAESWIQSANVREALTLAASSAAGGDAQFEILQALEYLTMLGESPSPA